jgi:muconolactone delta-isomerase
MWLNQVTSTHPPIAYHIKEINYLAQHPELFELDPGLFHTNESA